MAAAYSKKELKKYFSKKSARNRPAGRRKEDSMFKKAVLLGCGVLGAGLAGVFLLVIYMLALIPSLPTFEQLENPEVDLATVLYTADGKLLTRFARQDRTPVSLDSVSVHVVNALIATEDYRFYDHWGIDVIRLGSSVVRTLLGNRQGGSTITQQLARNLYSEVGNEISINRKLKEAMTALQLERNYTKNEILEMYLNTVPFGYNSFGIQTASQTYFGKSASKLTLSESAVLVGMLKGTTFYNPLRHPERARDRRNLVLTQMVRYGNLSPEQAADAKSDSLRLSFNRLTHTDNLAPYFAERIRLWMRDWAEETGHNIYTDGLVVYTTLDSRMQRAAQQAVHRQLDALQAVVDVDWSTARTRVRSRTEFTDFLSIEAKGDFHPFDLFWEKNPDVLLDMIRETDQYRTARKSGLSDGQALDALRHETDFIDSLQTAKTRLEAGLVVIDPVSRQVKAWVGGRDFAIDKYDHVAVARRQPGSTFKPFLYTAAIDNGYSPYYRLLDDSVTINLPGAQEPWKPKNAGDKYSRRLMTLREGLAGSVNAIAARLVDEVGPEQVANYARLMGVSSPLERVHSLALGTSDVQLLEMTNAYATLASGGFYADPMMVTRITDRAGNILADFTTEQKEVLSAETAFTMVDMLRGVIDHGTGVRIRGQWGIRADVAGKTGTTQGGADGWFILMHPQLVTGAWVGFNDPRVRFRDWWGEGSHNALLVVGDFFTAATDSLGETFAESRFLPPDGYNVPVPVLDSGGETDVIEKKGGESKGRIGW
ncbi:MAG: PBP1A family penicillin-binding protein [Rhodothermales bacterium]